MGEIVGVAADVKSVLPDPGPVTLQVYQPMAQEPRPYNEIAVRTNAVPPSGVLQSMRDVMATRSRPAGAPVANGRRDDRSRQLLHCDPARHPDSFAVLGLGLASLGISGVIARTMAQRAGEFAIRFALGACAKDITHIVLISGAQTRLSGRSSACSGRSPWPGSSPPTIPRCI